MLSIPLALGDKRARDLGLLGSQHDPWIGRQDSECAAERVVNQKMFVREDRSLHSDLVAKAVGFGAIGALTGYCLAECQDEGSVARAYGYAALAFVTAALFMVAVALGGRD